MFDSNDFKKLSELSDFARDDHEDTETEPMALATELDELELASDEDVVLLDDERLALLLVLEAA